MKLSRPALALWILFLVAVAGVYVEIRGVELRYELADRRKRLHAAVLEQRSLRIDLETARRPEALARRARALSVVRSPLSDSKRRTAN